MRKTRIEFQDVTKSYGGVKVVDNLSLKVDEGELVVLLGGSGSGKTTTLKMVNRIIEPTAGIVLLDGNNVQDLAAHVVRRSIGYVFQKVGLFPHMTVAENIAITPSLLGREAGWIKEKVDSLLEMVELEHSMRDRWPTELSGGQQQRVGVARALAAEPHIMLLDEPFGALDPLTRDRLQRFFLDLRARLSITAIFVTHDMVEALLLGDRIAVMNEGCLVQIGPPRELMRAPADSYVKQLMGAPRRQAQIVDSLLEDTPL